MFERAADRSGKRQDGEIYSSKSDVLHEVLTLMTKMEAAQFLED